MRKIIAAGIILSLLLPVTASAAVKTKAKTAAKNKARNYNCKDFKLQSDAQAFFITSGGPKKDPHGLDKDKDGIACEDL